MIKDTLKSPELGRKKSFVLSVSNLNKSIIAEKKEPIFISQNKPGHDWCCSCFLSLYFLAQAVNNKYCQTVMESEDVSGCRSISRYCHFSYANVANEWVSFGSYANEVWKVPGWENQRLKTVKRHFKMFIAMVVYVSGKMQNGHDRDIKKNSLDM